MENTGVYNPNLETIYDVYQQVIDPTLSVTDRRKAVTDYRGLVAGRELSVLSPDVVTDFLKVDLATGTRIHALLLGLEDPTELPGVKEYVNGCHNLPQDSYLILQGMNEVMNECGVEGIHYTGYEVDAEYGEVIAEYVNRGDTYSPTVLYDTEGDRFLLSSWGSFLEKWEEEHGEDMATDCWDNLTPQQRIRACKAADISIFASRRQDCPVTCVILRHEGWFG